MTTMNKDDGDDDHYDYDNNYGGNNVNNYDDNE